MDINVKVRFESPELMASLLALAEALPRMNLGDIEQKKEGQAAKTQSIEAKSLELAPNPENIVAAEAQRKQPTIEEIRTVMAEKNKEGHREEIKEIIKKHGANKLTEIDSKEYHQLMKEVIAISNYKRN